MLWKTTTLDNEQENLMILNLYINPVILLTASKFSLMQLLLALSALLSSMVQLS